MWRLWNAVLVKTANGDIFFLTLHCGLDMSSWLSETKPAWKCWLGFFPRLQLTSSWLCFPKLHPEWAHHPYLSLPWSKGQQYYKPGLTHQDPGAHSSSTWALKLFREVRTSMYGLTYHLTSRAPSADFLSWLHAGGLILGCRHL